MRIEKIFAIMNIVVKLVKRCLIFQRFWCRWYCFFQHFWIYRRVMFARRFLRLVLLTILMRMDVSFVSILLKFRFLQTNWWFFLIYLFFWTFLFRTDSFLAWCRCHSHLFFHLFVFSLFDTMLLYFEQNFIIKLKSKQFFRGHSFLWVLL